MTERIALFIDGSNFHQTVKGLGFDIDYKRLLLEFGRRGRIVRAYYYMTIKEDNFSISLRPLLDWLDYNGFAVRTKLAKEFDDGNGRRKTKRNMGVELAVDALELSPRIDHAFLFSGDGDLRAVVQALQRLGVRVTVVSSGRSTARFDELRREADSTIDIADLKTAIKRTPPIVPQQ
jgi:uncharacterized LabA/DUF88 family protein